MDIKTKKLNLIEYLINTQDEKIIDEIETTITVKTNYKFDVLRKEDILKRAKNSNKDIINGKISNQEQLQKESLNW